jgi:hypothetical protein
VRPFRLNFFFAYKRNEAKWDPFRICFTCSLQKFRSIFSLLFASFRFKFFASLQLNYFRFEAKQNENFFFASNISFRFKKHFFRFEMLVSNKLFADYSRTDTYTLTHTFKPIDTHIDTPVQAYIFRLIQSYIDTHI